MDAIEIYQKILEITKDQKFEDVNTAINFARNKIESDHYAKMAISTPLGSAIGSNCTASLAQAQYVGDYQAKQQAEAIQLVRNIVREEIAAVDEPKKEAA